MGYGRGGRMTIEKDRVEILSGVDNKGRTTGSPVTFRIPNRDFKIDTLPVVTRPRPGHADLAGVLKYDRRDVRDILERASARETAARVAVGSVCKQLLRKRGVEILSHTLAIGGVEARRTPRNFRDLRSRAEKSPLRCADPAAARKMVQKIDEAKKAGDTLGGIFEVRIMGISREILADRAFLARLTSGIMSIQTLKGVEMELISGLGSNQPQIFLRGAMKPLATLMKPLRSADIRSKKSVSAAVERSDVTAVPACGVVAEAMAAFVTSKYCIERFVGGNLCQTFL